MAPRVLPDLTGRTLVLLTEIEMSGGKVYFGGMISNPGWDVVWDTGMTYPSDIWPAGIKMEEDEVEVMPGWLSC